MITISIEVANVAYLGQVLSTSLIKRQFRGIKYIQHVHKLAQLDVTE